MREVLSLTAPFFGLVFLGFCVGRIANRPASGLEWLNIFIVYVALPALFFQILSKTPVEELSNVGFIAAVVAGTGGVLVAGFLIAMVRTRGDVERSTILALVGGYANNGYLGPGLAITALGASATVPVALIFAFENVMFFVATPIMMAIAGAQRSSPFATARLIVTRILTHPFILAVIAGASAAALEFTPPLVLGRLLDMLTDAAAPCALFAMGVTVALQPLPSGRAMGDLSVFLTIKLVDPPGRRLPRRRDGGRRSPMADHGGPHGGAAAGDQRVRAGDPVRTGGGGGVQRGARRHRRRGVHRDGGALRDPLRRPLRTHHMAPSPNRIMARRSGPTPRAADSAAARAAVGRNAPVRSERLSRSTLAVRSATSVLRRTS